MNPTLLAFGLEYLDEWIQSVVPEDLWIGVYLVWIVAGLFGLGLGANLLVKGAVRLALRIGLTPAIVGATIVAFGTSAPELITAVVASSQGKVDLAFGAIVGSNIANIMLIIGVVGLMKPIKGDPTVLRWDGPWMMIAALSLILFTWINWSPFGVASAEAGFVEEAPRLISNSEGVIMLLLMVGFLITSVIRSRRTRTEPTEEVQEELAALQKSPWYLDVVYLLAGLVILTLGAERLVFGASGSADYIGVDPIIAGLTIMAIGTSLPELATSIAAAKKGHADLAIANVTGSNIQNIVLCLAAAAAVSATGGLPVDMNGSIWDLGMLMIATLIFTAYLLIWGTVNRARAGILLFGYVSYVLYLIWRTKYAG